MARRTKFDLDFVATFTGRLVDQMTLRAPTLLSGWVSMEEPSNLRPQNWEPVTTDSILEVFRPGCLLLLRGLTFKLSPSLYALLNTYKCRRARAQLSQTGGFNGEESLVDFGECQPAQEELDGAKKLPEN